MVAFGRLALDDLRSRKRLAAAPEDHLLAAEAWLCRAHDASTDGGVSYGYTARGGWRPSYPETSGYIATTFLRLARRRDASYGDRAERILRWLLAIQNDDGSFANPRYGLSGIVFDTGQILFGLVRGHQATGAPELLAAARRAADWLTTIADDRLRWTRNEHLDTPHVYNARTAWALLVMNEIEPDPRAKRSHAAISTGRSKSSSRAASSIIARSSAAETRSPTRSPTPHADCWRQGSSSPNPATSMPPDAAPTPCFCISTHADTFRPMMTVDGLPAARSCLPHGQLPVRDRLGSPLRDRGGAAYPGAMARALDFVLATQDVGASDPGVRGGIKGSDPVWGRYAPLSLPNWATKFFVDAMWLRKDLGR
jgi:hypothetical protein